MTREAFLQMFPHASADTLRQNAELFGWGPEAPQRPKRRTLAKILTDTYVQLPISRETLPDCDKTPSPVPERRPRSRSLAKAKAEGSDPKVYLVRVVSFRVRLLDEDNLVPKWHIDALRYAGILPSDAPGKARIETTQKKVRSPEEERTEITVEVIEPPAPPAP